MKTLLTLCSALIMVVSLSAFDAPTNHEVNSSIEEAQGTWYGICHTSGHENDYSVARGNTAKNVHDHLRIRGESTIQMCNDAGGVVIVVNRNARTAHFPQ